MPPPFFGGSRHHVSVPAELASEVTLLAHLGLEKGELARVWWFGHRMYHSFPLGRPGRKPRIINAPQARLKHLQRRIAPLLDRLYRVRHPVHGFVPIKSVKTNAEAHLRKRHIVNLDLQDFFPSIGENRVIGVLVSIGLDARTAAIIARICTYQGRLPQGAPTSPILSNMICFRLDRALMTFAKSARCIYTRYADDLTFSSNQSLSALFDGALPTPGRFSPDLLKLELRSVIAANGFRLNPEKAHYADRNSRRMVTGLKVNELVNVDRRYIRNLRAALLSVKLDGPVAAEEKFRAKIGGTSKLIDHLAGKISWLRFIRGQTDPVFRAMALRFNGVYPERAIEITPTPEEVRDRATWVIEHFEGKMWQGSAFFLKDVGLVTAAHCVQAASDIFLYHPSKPANRFKVSVAKWDKTLDLAILDHGIPSTEFYELERSMRVVAMSEDLTAIGYPGFGPGDGLNVRDGKVSALPVKSAVALIEVTLKLAQGMSGGPLLDAGNAVVGVIHKGGQEEDRDLAVNINMLDKL